MDDMLSVGCCDSSSHSHAQWFEYTLSHSEGGNANNRLPSWPKLQQNRLEHFIVDNGIVMLEAMQMSICLRL